MINNNVIRLKILASLFDWQQAASSSEGLSFSNPDVHSVLVSPAFEDPINHDYYLKQGSSAAIAGENQQPVGPYINNNIVIGYKLKS